MPKVTPEHTAARRRQILNAGHACFLRDGFHATSMQDIQRQAHLSAGAIYLYFRSKEQIVIAIASEALDDVAKLFDTEAQTATASDIEELVVRLLAAADRLEEQRQLFGIVIQVWSELMRNGPMREVLGAKFAETIAHLDVALTAFRDNRAIDPQTDVKALSTAVLGLLQGYIVQRTVFPEMMTRERYETGIRALITGAR